MNPLIQTRIEQSEIRIFKAIFPDTTNHYHTLFGGKAMAMMDEAAFITATRFCRKKVVTISSGKIDFKEPIPSGTIVELLARVAQVGNTSLKIRVDIFQEEMYRDNTRRKSISGLFTFVALDKNNRPTPVIRGRDNKILPQKN